MDYSSRQQKDMSLKVVLGTVEKNRVDQKSIKDAATLNQDKPQTNPQSIAAQSNLAKAVLNNDAVVSTLRGFRTSSLGNSESLKDVKKASELAESVAERIREDKDGEATGAHDGLSSEKSGRTLVN